MAKVIKFPGQGKEERILIPPMYASIENAISNFENMLEKRGSAIFHNMPKETYLEVLTGTLNQLIALEDRAVKDSPDDVRAIASLEKRYVDVIDRVKELKWLD